jgi:tetratricopeptide (TPR) repeat protein
MRTRRIPFVVAAAVSVGFGACSAPALPAELGLAYEREAAGDHDGAIAAFRSAQKSCSDPSASRLEREDCARALIGEAEVLERTGRTDEAIAAYAAIPDRTGGSPPPSSQGLWRAGRLAYDADRVPEAAGYLWRLVTEYPDEAFAADAVAFVVMRTRSVDTRTLWGRLSELYPRLDHTAVADNLLWALADLAEHELADPTAARELYDRIPRDHPASGLRDDARWHAARISREQNDPAGAAERLRALLATREVALGTGSYFSVWLDDAQLELGRVLRDDLGDLAGASSAFAELPEDYPRSILVDDALDELATTELARGNAAGACRAAKRLLKHDPESRFAGRAKELENGC